MEEFSSFHLDDTRINLAIDCAIKEGDEIYLYDWKTGKSLSEDLSIQLCCYALYAMEKWHVHPESLRIIEYNLSFVKSNWFLITHGEVEDIKGYIKGSIKDMQSLLVDLGSNVPMEEDTLDIRPFPCITLKQFTACDVVLPQSFYLSFYKFLIDFKRK